MAGWRQPTQTPGPRIWPVRPSEPAAPSSSCGSPRALLWKQTSKFYPPLPQPSVLFTVNPPSLCWSRHERLFSLSIHLTVIWNSIQFWLLLFFLTNDKSSKSSHWRSSKIVDIFALKMSEIIKLITGYFFDSRVFFVSTVAIIINSTMIQIIQD